MKERVKLVLEWERRWREGEGLLIFQELSSVAQDKGPPELARPQACEGGWLAFRAS